jgi:tetratricopeptide (TPR) repeat protein
VLGGIALGAATALASACGSVGAAPTPVVELGPGPATASCEGAACEGTDPARPVRATPQRPLSEVVRDASPDGERPGDPAGEIARLEDAARGTGPGVDESLYRLGRAYERADRLDEARKTYFSLIQKHPTSKRIPYAYLAFGELFSAEAAADPSKLALAEQAYLEVLKHPPPENGAFGYAHHQLARTLVTRSDPARALGHAKQAVEHASAYPASPGAARIADAARALAIDAYAAVGRPAATHDFFRRLAGEPAATAEARTLILAARVAARYTELQDFAAATELFTDLFARGTAAHLCTERRVAPALETLSTSGTAPQRQEASRLARLHTQRCASK